MVGDRERTYKKLIAMARKKVKVAWIANDTARRVCFRKRREGLFKKVMELSTLCAVDAAAVAFCQNEEPAFWPSKPSAEELFRRYEKIPAMERSKKMLNQENFMKDRIAKIEEQRKKCLKRSQEMEMNDLIYHIVNENRMFELPTSDLTNLMRFLEEKYGEIGRRAHHLHELPLISGNSTIFPSSSSSSSYSSLSGMISSAMDNPNPPNPPNLRIVDKKTLLNHIPVNNGRNEIGMRPYQRNIQGLLREKYYSDLPMCPMDETIMEFSQDDIWLPFGTMGGSGAGASASASASTGIPPESFLGSTDLAVGGNEFGSDMNLGYGTGGGSIHLHGAANQMELPDISNSSWITDLLMAENPLGLPDGNSTTDVTVSIGNPIGNIGCSTSELQMGTSMELDPGLISTNGEKIMALPQQNVASSRGKDGRQQYDDVNYDAWFESLGV